MGSISLIPGETTDLLSGTCLNLQTDFSKGFNSHMETNMQIKEIVYLIFIDKFQFPHLSVLILLRFEQISSYYFFITPNNIQTVCFFKVAFIISF